MSTTTTLSTFSTAHLSLLYLLSSFISQGGSVSLLSLKALAKDAETSCDIVQAVSPFLKRLLTVPSGRALLLRLSVDQLISLSLRTSPIPHLHKDSVSLLGLVVSVLQKIQTHQKKVSSEVKIENLDEGGVEGSVVLEKGTSGSGDGLGNEGHCTRVIACDQDHQIGLVERKTGCIYKGVNEGSDLGSLGGIQALDEHKGDHREEKIETGVGEGKGEEDLSLKGGVLGNGGLGVGSGSGIEIEIEGGLGVGVCEREEVGEGQVTEEEVGKIIASEGGGEKGGVDPAPFNDSKSTSLSLSTFEQAVANEIGGSLDSLSSPLSSSLAGQVSEKFQAGGIAESRDCSLGSSPSSPTSHLHHDNNKSKRTRQRVKVGSLLRIAQAKIVSAIKRRLHGLLPSKDHGRRCTPQPPRYDSKSASAPPFSPSFRHSNGGNYQTTSNCSDEGAQNSMDPEVTSLQKELVKLKAELAQVVLDINRGEEEKRGWMKDVREVDEYKEKNGNVEALIVSAWSLDYNAHPKTKREKREKKFEQGLFSMAAKIKRIEEMRKRMESRKRLKEMAKLREKRTFLASKIKVFNVRLSLLRRQVQLSPAALKAKADARREERRRYRSPVGRLNRAIKKRCAELVHKILQQLDISAGTVLRPPGDRSRIKNGRPSSPSQDPSPSPSTSSTSIESSSPYPPSLLGSPIPSSQQESVGDERKVSSHTRLPPGSPLPLSHFSVSGIRKLQRSSTTPSTRSTPSPVGKKSSLNTSPAPASDSFSTSPPSIDLSSHPLPPHSPLPPSLPPLQSSLGSSSTDISAIERPIFPPGLPLSNSYLSSTVDKEPSDGSTSVPPLSPLHRGGGNDRSRRTRAHPSAQASTNPASSSTPLSIPSLCTWTLPTQAVRCLEISSLLLKTYGDGNCLFNAAVQNICPPEMFSTLPKLRHTSMILRRAVTKFFVDNRDDSRIISILKLDHEPLYDSTQGKLVPDEICTTIPDFEAAFNRDGQFGGVPQAIGLACLLGFPFVVYLSEEGTRVADKLGQPQRSSTNLRRNVYAPLDRYLIDRSSLESIIRPEFLVNTHQPLATFYSHDGVGHYSAYPSEIDSQWTNIGSIDEICNISPNELAPPAGQFYTGRSIQVPLSSLSLPTLSRSLRKRPHPKFSFLDGDFSTTSLHLDSDSNQSDSDFDVAPPSSSKPQRKRPRISRGKKTKPAKKAQVVTVGSGEGEDFDEENLMCEGGEGDVEETAEVDMGRAGETSRDYYRRILLASATSLFDHSGHKPAEAESLARQVLDGVATVKPPISKTASKALSDALNSALAHNERLLIKCILPEMLILWEEICPQAFKNGVPITNPLPKDWSVLLRIVIGHWNLPDGGKTSATVLDLSQTGRLPKNTSFLWDMLPFRWPVSYTGTDLIGDFFNDDALPIILDSISLVCSFAAKMRIPIETIGGPVFDAVSEASGLQLHRLPISISWTAATPHEDDEMVQQPNVWLMRAEGQRDGEGTTLCQSFHPSFFSGHWAHRYQALHQDATNAFTEQLCPNSNPSLPLHYYELSYPNSPSNHRMITGQHVYGTALKEEKRDQEFTQEELEELDPIAANHVAYYIKNHIDEVNAYVGSNPHVSLNLQFSFLQAVKRCMLDRGVWTRSHHRDLMERDSSGTLSPAEKKELQVWLRKREKQEVWAAAHPAITAARRAKKKAYDAKPENKKKAKAKRDLPANKKKRQEYHKDYNAKPENKKKNNNRKKAFEARENEREYECSVCQKKLKASGERKLFANKATLTRHMRTIHPDHTP